MANPPITLGNMREAGLAKGKAPVGASAGAFGRLIMQAIESVSRPNSNINTWLVLRLLKG